MLELTVKNVFVSADSFTSWSVGKCWRTVCVLVKKSYQLVLRQPTCNTIQRLQCSTSWDWKLTCRFKLEEKSGDFMILRNVNIWHKKKSIVVWVGKMSETGEKCPKTTSSDVSSLPQAKIFSFLRVSSAGVELKSNMPPCRPSRSYLCLQDVQRHIKARRRKTLRQPVVKKKRCGSAARIPATRTNSTPVTGGDAASHKTQTVLVQRFKCNISGSRCCFLKYLAVRSALRLNKRDRIQLFCWYDRRWGQTLRRHSECERENSDLSRLQTHGSSVRPLGNVNLCRRFHGDPSADEIFQGWKRLCLWTLSVNWFSRVLVFYLVVNVLLFPLAQTFIWEFVQYESWFFTCQ